MFDGISLWIKTPIHESVSIWKLKHILEFGVLTEYIPQMFKFVHRTKKLIYQKGSMEPSTTMFKAVREDINRNKAIAWKVGRVSSMFELVAFFFTKSHSPKIVFFYSKVLILIFLVFSSSHLYDENYLHYHYQWCILHNNYYFDHHYHYHIKLTCPQKASTVWSGCQANAFCLAYSGWEAT